MERLKTFYTSDRQQWNFLCKLFEAMYEELPEPKKRHENRAKKYNEGGLPEEFREVRLKLRENE